jgi:ABC-2 type transport system permease protein
LDLSRGSRHPPRGIEDGTIVNTLRTIFRLEWRNLWGDGATAMILVMLSLSVGYAILNGARFIRTQEVTLNDFLRIEKHEVDLRREQNVRTTALIDQGALNEIAEWSNDPKITPLWPSWDFQLQHSAVQPYSVLAFLAIGQSDVYPAAYKPYSPGRYFKETVVSVEQSENPARTMTGHVDLAFVMLYLLPLFVIGVSYDLIASEQESGLLSLILAQPVSLRMIVFARALVRIVVVLCATLLLVVATVGLAGVDWRQEGTIPRFLLWLAAVCAYAGFWFGLAVLVNTRRKGPASNAVVLAACWLVLTLLLPAAIRFTANAISPIPPRSELRNAKRDAIMQTGVDLWEQGVRELDDENSRTTRLVKEFLAANPSLEMTDSSPPGQKVRFRLFDYSEPENVRNRNPKWQFRPYIQRFEIVNAARTAAIEKLIGPAQDRFERQYRKQHSFFAAASYLSPESLLEGILTHLSGTSPEQHDRFLEQVERQHRQWKEFFLKRSLHAQLLRPEDFAQFPYFQYEPEALDTIAKHISFPLAMLALLTVGITAVALIRVGLHPCAE